jgi:allophanate hydrolase subunit 1
MRAASCKRSEKENIMNKTIFEEKWPVIRGLINAKWSLMVEYDLNKVDKAEVKFDKFVTMLQVKYGYTRQEARDLIGVLWKEYESGNQIKV